MQYVFRIQLNVQPDQVVLSGPKKEVNATAKHAIPNTCPSNDTVPTSEASLVLLQGKGHSNDWTASERLMSMGQDCHPASPAQVSCQTVRKQLAEPATWAS
jgi:hypothetical protein